MSTDPATFMARALELAERGRGRVEPNPMVGAVVVRDGRIVGEGFHERFGGAHAEVAAIRHAGPACRDATLYVTLEPCSHHGKTPPCTDAVLAAGLARVVAAMLDPFEPRAASREPRAGKARSSKLEARSSKLATRGIEVLRKGGVECDVGLLEAEARRLNAPFVKLVTRGLPFVTAKWAMSLDGKTATHTGDSRWISSPASRELVHTLRGQVDAILVGSGTARADDPLLTARPPGPRVATRIVADSRAALSLDSQLVRTTRDAPVLVATVAQAPAHRRAALEAAGAEVLVLPPPLHPPVNGGNEGGRVSVRALMEELGRRRMTNVLLEGGGELCAATLDAGLVDRLWVFLAPKLIGGRHAKTPVEGRGATGMADALRAAEWSVRRIGDDAFIEAWL